MKNVIMPFFSYFGGKTQSALYYPTPRYETIVEPFAGAAGYSVNHFSKKVILCDLNPVIAEIWDYLIHATFRDILALPDVLIGQTVDDLNVCQEAKNLIGFWIQQGRHAVHKNLTPWLMSKVILSAEKDMPVIGHWGRGVRQRLASQVSLIRHWKIYNCSYQDCPYDGDATWFIDPPYVARPEYVFGSKLIDFEHLGNWCQSRRGQVIVCENHGAKWLPFRSFVKVSGSNRQGRKKSLEVIWTNDNSEATNESVRFAGAGGP